MLYFYTILNCLCFCFALKINEGWNYINLHCRNDDNAPVDWWYLYKPAGEAAPYDDSGRNYSFIVSEIVSRWQKPDRHITTNNMLQHTLAPIYRHTYVDRVAYLVFEDAEPTTTSRGSKASGILMADEVGGIFISHTVPNLVTDLVDRPKFPESELINGHLLVCISMDISSLNKLALRVRQAGPKVTMLQIPEQMEVVIPAWMQTTDSEETERTSAPNNHVLEFVSKQSGFHGILMVRSPGQTHCLYRTFARRQSILMDVYSPDGKHKTNRCDKEFGTRSIDAISLKIVDEKVIYLSNKTDMTRFGVSTAAHWQRRGSGRTQYWTCTSTLDLADKSGKGGIMLCIDDYQVWSAFDNLKIKEPDCGRRKKQI